MNSSLREYAETRDRYTQLPEGVSVSRFDNGRGTPALVTQADTSYPILKRLGFEDACDTHRLEDPR
jgi:hypothetical protein